MESAWRRTPAAGLNAWVQSPEPLGTARVRLFCFPYAGGGASVFRLWSAALPTTIDVCPIQLPGREARLREPPFSRLSPLAHALTDALGPYLDRPFVLFGHSMGALVAFELARELRRSGRPAPEHLFVSGRPAPQLAHHEPPMHALPEPSFIDRLCALDGTPEAVLADRELRELLLPLLRADFAVVETYTYRPEAPLDCPITVFGGLDDPRASRAELEAWRTHTTARFALHMLPGSHFFVRTAQDLLLQVLSQELEVS